MTRFNVRLRVLTAGCLVDFTYNPAEMLYTGINLRWKKVFDATSLTAALVTSLSLVQSHAVAAPQAAESAAAQLIPNEGRQITPTAPAGSRFEPLSPGLADFPDYTAGQAVTTVLSPDRKTLLILTSGYNLLNSTSGPNRGKHIPADSNQYVFVYDITNKIPIKRQVIQIPNTYNGIAFDPSGTTFYVAGGVDDDVHIYDMGHSGWAERNGSPIHLGHTAGVGLRVKPQAAGIAVSPNGAKLVVTNYYNDSVTILTKGSNGAWTVASELDLRPGVEDPALSGTPGGEYPFWVVINKNQTAYVSSIRDREIDVLDLNGTAKVSSRIKVTGQPLKMALNSAGTRLYAAEDESDTVAVVDTQKDRLIAEIPVGAPRGLLGSDRAGYTGNNTNSVTLSPDEKALYVTNGNTNNVAVVDLSDEDRSASVAGLIPTGWYPNSVSLSADGSYMYVVNGKSPTGPNPGFCHGGVLPGKSFADCRVGNEYDLQLVKAGFQSFPTPTRAELATLTTQVARNNHFSRTVSPAAQATMEALRTKIQHVIYIIKENRTYDQILGDLPIGNGDPDLTEFGQAITPNLHALAQQFVTLDNFYDRSEVSYDGWSWSTSARAPDVVERQVTVNYADRGLSYDSEGTNRDVNISYPTLAERLAANPLTPNDPNVLPGTVDTAAPDGPDDEVNTGYLWDQALRAGLTIRNYGFFVDLSRYNLTGKDAHYSIPELKNPAATGSVVAYAANQALRPFTDPYFRGFDNSFPDYYRYTEWAREFDAYNANGKLPRLSLVRFMHDHTGNFKTAIEGVNTPEIQEADNDYAVGLLVQKIANSRYKDNTLIFVIEDDSQDGADHVDTHRSIAFIVGPYVKQKALVTSTYNTVDFVRTIEEVLGLAPLNLNDALALPMADVFDLNQTTWNYTAIPSLILHHTTLPITYPAASKNIPKPAHDAAYWTAAAKGMDFSVEDRFDFARYNHILWKGLMGDKPYPEAPTGLDLRTNRAELLARYHQAQRGEH